MARSGARLFAAHEKTKTPKKKKKKTSFLSFVRSFLSL